MVKTTKGWTLSGLYRHLIKRLLVLVLILTGGGADHQGRLGASIGGGLREFHAEADRFGQRGPGWAPSHRVDDRVAVRLI